MHNDQRAYPVVDDDRLIGMVCFHDVRKISRENWARTKARDIMTPVENLLQIAPKEDAAEAMHALNRRGVNQLPVVEGSQLKGLIRRQDILKWLSLHGDK